MTYTALTRTITGITLNAITSEEIGSLLSFVIGTATYSSTIASVTADTDTTVILDASATLPVADGTVISFELAVVYNNAVDIITLNGLKKYLGMTDVSKDALLSEWITLLSRLVENKLVQPVQPIAIEEILNGDMSNRIYLEKGRIIALVGADEATRLSNLQYRILATDSWTNLLTDESFIYIEVNNWFIELLDYNQFPIGRKNIRVNYTAGFSPIPSDIIKMIYEMIQVMLDESAAGQWPRLGMQTQNRGGSGTTVGDTFIDMEPRWQKIIDRYKKII
jgi:hypothetical protein